jgi:hypothetical protein
MTGFGCHWQLLERVAERLESTLITTDHLLLTSWRAVRICQFLLGTTSEEAERLGVQALDAFARDGAGKSVDDAFRWALFDPNHARSRDACILPEVLGSKREEILLYLGEYDTSGAELIPKALAVIPWLRARFDQPGALLAGPRHRFELLTAVVVDIAAAEHNRRLASAVLLMLGKCQHEISGPLRLVGLIDEDLVVRVALNELGQHTTADQLHWSERISALWDDLPFLEGVRFTSEQCSITTTWLDRINSYVSYTHVLDRGLAPLILVQPSVVCSPLHSIVSLIGLLVLDGLTSSKDLVGMLHPGQVYEIDGKFRARFDGVAGPPVPGWLRLKFLDGIVFRPATMARRMVPIAERKLSRAKDFAAFTTSHDTEPVQRFFNWPEAIGVAAISGRVLFVASRRRAAELFAGVASNGTSLLDDGLISFLGSSPRAELLPGGPVVVVPSVTVARQLVDQGENVLAIVVDGYGRFYRGRHDLPFLLSGTTRPSIIVWSPKGYYPSEPPGWLSAHRQLALSPEDLSSIIRVDGDLAHAAFPRQESLSMAAIGPKMEKRWVDVTPTEREVVASVQQFIGVVSQSTELPEYWKYHLLSSATTLRSLVEATRHIGAISGSLLMNGRRPSPSNGLPYDEARLRHSRMSIKLTEGFLRLSIRTRPRETLRQTRFSVLPQLSRVRIGLWFASTLIKLGPLPTLLGERE